MNKALYDSRLKHLSDSEIDSLLSDFENSLPAKEIVKKYNIDASPKELSHILPPIEVSEKCPYCNIPMYVKAHRLSAHPGPAFCLICNHKQNDRCNCENCRKRKEKRKDFEKEKEKYTSIAEIEDLNTFSDLDIVVFASLIFSFYNEDTDILYVPNGGNEKELLRVLDCLDFFVNKGMLLPLLTEDSAPFNSKKALEYDYHLNLSSEAYLSLIRNYIFNADKIDISVQSVLLFWHYIQVSIAIQYIDIIFPQFKELCRFSKLYDVISTCIELTPLSLAKLLSLIDTAKGYVDNESFAKNSTNAECFTIFTRTLNNIFFTTNHENVPAKVIPPQLMTSIPNFLFSRFLENPMDGYTKALDVGCLKECYREDER